jgi:hypothetical protein
VRKENQDKNVSWKILWGILAQRMNLNTADRRSFMPALLKALAVAR